MISYLYGPTISFTISKRSWTKRSYVVHKKSTGVGSYKLERKTMAGGRVRRLNRRYARPFRCWINGEVRYRITHQ